MELGIRDRTASVYNPAAAPMQHRDDVDRVNTPVTNSSARWRGNEFYALQALEPLYVAGEPRDHIYRVEAGAIVVSYATTTEDDPDSCVVIEPGSYVGFGFLNHHTSSAIAAEATTVSCLTQEQFEQCVSENPAIAEQRAAAIEREYAGRRATCIHAGDTATPLQRVARLLVALSDLAAREGCGLRAVSDTLDSRFVAQLLDMPLDELSDSVRELARLGLVRVDTRSGILLHDVAGLEAAC